jgi:2-keto-4-pentenoate hydratase/2-oxohepta-3-ene-1,7-dioic acid hydratase in catechol pathway
VWDDVKNTPYFEFSLNINNEQRQQGDSRMMMRPVLALIADMSQHFTLEAGDIVLTGTPKGVGPLNVGDRIAADLSDYLHINTSVVAA